MKETTELSPVEKERIPVAYHEKGHGGVARYIGWGVGLETVVPQGNSLGRTAAVPNSSKSEEELLLDGIAIAAGGEEAENMCGIEDHSGCGSDRFRQRLLAKLYISLTGSIRSIGSIISEQRGRARGILECIGLGEHKRRSMILVRAGTLA